ncbi:MAG TPA: FUSC family protein [Microbacterium sp.]|nr:FUSC family protein [Microbacterium sp.]
MSDVGERPGLAWNWSFFLLGAIYALPALIVVPLHPIAGLALAVGVMPVAAFNLPGTRRGRRVIPLLGLASGLSMFLGSVLTQVPWLAVSALFGLAVGGAFWARHSRIGALMVVLCLPLTGIGLSISTIASGAMLGGLIILGSLYAFAVALLWPEHQVPPPPRQGRATTAETLTYGILLGLAGATAASIAYWLGLEHVGWPTGAALLVMRPARDQLVFRSVGRSISVLVGAFAAAGLAALNAGSVVTAIAVALVLAALAATQASRWYVAPGFTSFIALTLIMQTSDSPPAVRFTERVLETVLGIAVALFFGAVVPGFIRLRGRARARRSGSAGRDAAIPGSPPSSDPPAA